MPSFTKKAIIESFLHLVGKKPLEKITVRDIVDDCGINRNTFYYYFQDIYAVVEELCDTEIFEVDEAKETDVMAAFTGIFLRLSAFTLRYRKAVQNIYASMGRDGMEDYLFRPFDRKLADTVRSVATDAVSEKRLSILATGCRHMLVGLYIDWLKNDCKADPEALVREFASVFEGGVERVIENIKNTDKN